MGFFASLFGGGPNPEVQKMLAEGAIVLDVRTHAEFQGGHVAGSKNIPLQELGRHTKDIKAWKKPVVICCRSGARAGQALGVLQQAGVTCVNGGGWTKVNAAVAAQ
ncbi:MAG: rhodanese-like domain-containing protein [Saprospiraceae bacterium]